MSGADVERSETAGVVRPRGVHTIPYRDEIFHEILEELANGGNLVAICSAPDRPAISTFYRWLEKDPALWEAYTRAREIQAHAYAAKVVEEAVTAQDAAIGRLRMDALKWAAGKLAPKYYGDSTQLRHANADGEKLDTAPLVAEMLTLMGKQIPHRIEGHAREVARRAEKHDAKAQESVKAAWRPRVRAEHKETPAAGDATGAEDCGDLV